MESELKVELEKLNGNLDRIFDKMKDIDEDVKGLAADVKEIKSDVAGQGKEIAKIQATMEHNLSEIQKIWAEIKSVWDHFPKHKDDIKEYVSIIVKQESSKNKIWILTSVVGAAIAVIGAAFAVIQGLMGGSK